MKIVKYCDRELTEKENDLINHFTYYNNRIKDNKIIGLI